MRRFQCAEAGKHGLRRRVPGIVPGQCAEEKKIPVRSSKPGGDSLFQSVISSAGSLKALRQAPARRAPPLQELGRFQGLQRGPQRRPPHQEFDQQDRRPQVELSQHLTYQRLPLRAIGRPQMSLFAGPRRHPACHCATDGKRPASPMEGSRYMPSEPHLEILPK